MRKSRFCICCRVQCTEYGKREVRLSADTNALTTQQLRIVLLHPLALAGWQTRSETTEEKLKVHACTCWLWRLACKH